MADSFVITTNKLPKIANRVEDAGSKAIDEALKVGEQDAKAHLTPGHGVDTGEMKAGITSRKHGKKEGQVVNPASYGRYVEYGTTFMEAIPHMRPAARKMGDTFIEEMKDLEQNV